MGERETAILIVDGSYAFIGWKAIASGRIDYQKLIDFAQSKLPFGTKFVDKFWMDTQPKITNAEIHKKSTEDFDAKVNLLQNLGFQVPQYKCKTQHKHVDCDQCGNKFKADITVQSGVDSGISIRIMDAVYNPKITDVVLFAGDRDFAEAVQRFRDTGKNLYSISYKSSSSSLLKSLCGSKVYYIDDAVDKLRLDEKVAFTKGNKSEESIYQQSDRFKSKPSRESTVNPTNSSSQWESSYPYTHTSNLRESSIPFVPPSTLRESSAPFVPSSRKFFKQPIEADSHVKKGDWVCECGFHNFAKRTKCDACKNPMPLKNGEWICSCGYFNFSSRNNCGQCHIPIN